MQKRFVRFIMVLMAVVLVPALSKAAEAAPEDLAAEIYVRSGMERQIAEFPVQVQTTLDQAFSAQQKISAATHARLKEKAREVFTVESIKQPILKELRTALSEAQLRQILAWLDSATGKKCTKAEEDASGPKRMEEIQAFAAQIAQNKPDPARVQLMQAYDTALKASENAATVILNLRFAIAAAAMLSGPEENRISLAELKARLEKIRPELVENLRGFHLVAFLYTYRDLSLAELREYLSFIQSDTGVKYHAATMQGQEKALIATSMAWGKALVEIYEQAAKERVL